MFKRIGLNRNLAIISLTIFTNLFARYTWYALLPLHFRSLGANELQVGVVFTALMLARNLFGIVGGALGDRVGRKGMIAGATIAMGPFFILAGLSTELYVVAAMLVAVEMCGAFQWPPLNALIMESSEENRVARAFSFTESAVLIGLMLGPLAGAGLMSAFNLPMLIMANGVVLMLNGLVRAIGLREATTDRAVSMRVHVRAAIDTNVRWFIVMTVFVSASFGIVFGPFFAILAHDTWHNTNAEINLLWAVGSFASFLGIFLGRLSDHWGGKKVFLISAVGFGVTTIGWGFAPTWEWGVVPLVLSFLFSESMYMAQQTIQASITSPQTRASVIGVILTVSGFLGAMGPTLGAQFAQWGSAMPFVLAGAMGLLTIFAMMQIQAKDKPTNFAE